jgi:hypothetical protein
LGTVGVDGSFDGLLHGFLSDAWPFWLFMAKNAPKGEPHVRLAVFIRQVVFWLGQSGPWRCLKHAPFGGWEDRLLGDFGPYCRGIGLDGL